MLLLLSKQEIAEVKFDKSKVTPEQLSKAVEEKVGYKVKSYEIVKDKEGIKK